MLRDELGDLVIGVLEIAEYSRPGGTDLNTGRLQACMDPVVTEVTLLDDGNQRVDVSRIVWTRGETVLATDASMLIDL